MLPGHAWCPAPDAEPRHWNRKMAIEAGGFEGVEPTPTALP
ncbi:hypothetical protein CSC43_4909 [Pseudomonas aeruginosa]|nr:hypothetical protein Y880_06041 [Pseudomonas aeruginosa PAK]AVJ96592.1 hypothetical protein CSB94_1235 [Pseudomonas aeruginosa]AXA02510.1 hypothetical protein CSC44_2528 [Pseudomonas aeruginosa]RCH31259.1 hypothetical protein CSC43_4909 [Pseudomonas aeruginosa]